MIPTSKDINLNFLGEDGNKFSIRHHLIINIIILPIMSKEIDINALPTFQKHYHFHYFNPEAENDYDNNRNNPFNDPIFKMGIAVLIIYLLLTYLKYI